MASRRKASSTIGKEIDLVAMIETGPQGAYEALQLYRSRAIRYKTKNDEANAIESLYKGAKTLFLNNYKNAGSELANLLIDFLIEFNTSASPSQIDMLLELNLLFGSKALAANNKNGSDDNNEFNHNHFSNRLDFLKNCVKWSVKNGNYELGEPRIHVALGQCLWETVYPKQSEGTGSGVMESYNKAVQMYHVNRSSAIYHIVCGESPQQLNEIIQGIEQTSFSNTGGSSSSSNSDDLQQKGIVTKDRALTLGVLTFLSLDNLKDANELLNCYRLSLAEKVKNSASDNTTHKKKNANDDDFQFAIESPLEAFCRYLLLTCQRDAQPLFKTLVNTYAKVLDFDENVPALLTGPIGLKFFNIQQKVQVNPMMNMLQQMLSK